MVEYVDTSASVVPVPKYYLVQHESGLWHLVDPEEYGKVAYGEADTVETRCGENVTVTSEDELKFVTDWLTVDDFKNYSADELIDDFVPFSGQCKNCLNSHQSRGPTDLARLEVPDNK